MTRRSRRPVRARYAGALAAALLTAWTQATADDNGEWVLVLSRPLPRWALVLGRLKAAGDAGATLDELAAATALKPAVRTAVTQLPSMTARGTPVSLSSKVTSALMPLKPRSGLRGFSTSDFTANNGGSSAAASVAIM